MLHLFYGDGPTIDGCFYIAWYALNFGLLSHAICHENSFYIIYINNQWPIICIDLLHNFLNRHVSIGFDVYSLVVYFLCWFLNPILIWCISVLVALHIRHDSKNKQIIKKQTYQKLTNCSVMLCNGMNLNLNMLCAALLLIQNGLPALHVGGPLYLLRNDDRNWQK